ncbi:MAG: aminotransferase class I/II-fold pyridoxal phosphate-dependent enzyme, partial [Candidatus Binatia bacterium]
GFGDGLDQDATGLGIMADHRSELLVAISCSKTFGLYRERTGCAIVICPGNNDQTNISRNMMALGRANYSTPPSHGAAIVRVILEDDELRLNWEAELGQMRNRLRELRKRLLMSLRSRGESSQHDFITSHRGMFSILGATNEQVERLRDQFAIYVTAGGRINVAGLREDKIDIIADALVAVGL